VIIKLKHNITLSIQNKTVVEHANVFIIVDTRNIEIQCDFGSSYSGFNYPPISLSSQIPNLSIINHGFTMVYTRNIEIPCILEAHMVALTIPPSLSIPKYLICLL